MPKEDIVEGIKAAVAKGESLNKAMLSFYNAGYPRDDIEGAARDSDAPNIKLIPRVAQPSLTSATPQFKQIPQQIQPKEELVKQKEPEKSTSNVPKPTYSTEENQQESDQEYPPLQQPQTVQKASKYGEKPSPLGALIIFILVFFLLFLIGILVSVFLFKERLATFFNSFIG